MDYAIEGTLGWHGGPYHFLDKGYSNLEGAIKTAQSIFKEQRVIGTLKILDENNHLVKVISQNSIL